MHDEYAERWTLEEAVYRCAEYGGGTDEVWHIPESGVIHPGTGPNIWDGLMITFWTNDA
jgi:hypothetical protein